MFGWFRKKAAPEKTARQALIELRDRVEMMNIPVIADDFDAGYDMAVDEVLVLINNALYPETRDEDDVTYGEMQ